MPAPSLIARCLANDSAAWAELVGLHRALVLRVLVRTVGVDGCVGLEDLEQEVWSKLLANRGEALRGLVEAEPPAIRAFLYRTALNVGRDHGRRLSVRKVVHPGPLEEIAGNVPDPAEPLEGAYERLERRQSIFDALEEVLTPPHIERDRLVFRAHYVDGLTAGEISAMGVGLAPKGVETLLLRMVQKVRTLLHSRKEDAA
ncbi:RNA polymerase sigma factor [Vulgatibacter sp.]|uniref:RNA polymerase sigma factor n=1 Tax=Vulgatibacter sp. TaxID=1971226 RepID=UPI00356A9FAB